MALIGTLTSGISGLQAFTKGLEVIGSNIANVNTVAYKGSSTTFSDTFSNTMQSSAPSSGSSSNQSAMQVGTGVAVGRIAARFTQGGIESTGVPTDLAISGNGFFIVRNPVDGSLFATRAGDFRKDDNGFLVTSDGYRVQGLTGTPPTVAGDIQIGDPADRPTGYFDGTPYTGAPGDVQTITAGSAYTDAVTTKTYEMTSFAIDASGNVIESYADGSSKTTNRVRLQDFADPSALEAEGANLFTGFEAAGALYTWTDATKGLPGEGGLGTIQDFADRARWRRRARTCSPGSRPRARFTPGPTPPRGCPARAVSARSTRNRSSCRTWTSRKSSRK
ncbi:flagellar hook-basal body protein [Termitidicoccus mucosus]|uniref:flagellar hook-basal body protein n=1 Tax=Termitidicoccus mucosus TaxID=1184151 RepID=UPI003CCBF493